MHFAETFWSSATVEVETNCGVRNSVARLSVLATEFSGLDRLILDGPRWEITLPRRPSQAYARVGDFTYTIAGFAAGSSHSVRLHFAETFWTSAGKRRFNVSINSMQVLTNLDIFAAAGAMNKAVIQQFAANAKAQGIYVIQFTAVTDKSLISGIEVQ